MTNTQIGRLLNKLDSIKVFTEHLRDISAKPYQDHMWACLKSVNDAIHHAENCFREFQK